MEMQQPFCHGARRAGPLVKRIPFMTVAFEDAWDGPITQNLRFLSTLVQSALKNQSM